MTKKVQVILKHSSIEDKIPTAEQLEVGELALNNFKGKEFLSFKNTDGEIVKISPSGNDSHYITGVDLSSYDTIEDVNSKLSKKLDATAYTKPDLSSYAKKSDIPSVPTKTSELTNDSGFITGVNLSNYDTIADVDSKLNKKLDATAYTTPDLSSYAKKSDIPSVPTKTSQLSNDSGFITGVDLSNYDTITDVDSKLATKLDATAYTATDLSSYAKKSDIPTVPTKTSELTNDSGFITGVNLSNYATKTDLNSKLDATAYTAPDLSSYAKKSDIPDTSNYATTTQLATKLDATAYTKPDLSSYAKKSDIPTVPTKTSQLTNDSGYITGVDLSSYDTIEDVNSKLNGKLDATAYTAPDLSSYAKKSELPSVPTKTSQLTNDSGFITGVDLSSYDTISDVDSKLSTKLDATAYTATDLSSYAKKSDIPSKTSQLSNDSNYITKTDLDKKLDATAYTTPDLSSYAKKSELPSVPTKTSELTNDSGFITGVDLSNYDTVANVNSKLSKKLDATAYTPTDLSSYAKKTDIPSVPTKTSQLTNDSHYITGVDLSSYDTIEDVNSKLNSKLDATAYTAPDLSSYAKKSDIPTVPTKTSQLTNDSGYITGVDLSSYDTISDVDSKLATKLDATAYTKPDLSSYAKKSDIPSKTSQLSNDSNYVTSTQLATKLDATAYTAPDLSSYAKKTEIPTVPTKISQLTNDSGYITGVDLSSYDTIADVDSKLSTKLDATAYTAPDLSSYAKKSDIPTKTSQLSNDSNYVTKTDLDKKLDATAYTSPDLSSYAKKSDIPSVPTKTSQLTNDSHYTKKVELTQAAYNALTSKDEDTIYVITDSNVESVTSDTLKDYAKKSDIPTVPTKTSQLTNDSGFITSDGMSDYYKDVDRKLATKLDATAYTKPDLSSYAKKSDVPTKTSQLTNDSGYITGVDLSSYDTIEDVNSKLNGKLDATAYTAPDLSSYAKKSDIPDTSNYATTTQLATKQDKVNNIVVGKTASYTLQSVTESEWENLSGSADSNTIYFIK